MNRPTASNFAGIVAKRLMEEIEREGSYRSTLEAIHSGVFEQLSEFAPDACEAIVLGEHEGEKPIVLALWKTTLYICRYRED